MKNKKNHPIELHSRSVFCKGIYYLFHGGEVVYIGMSLSSCMNRVNAHSQEGKKKFSKFLIFNMFNKSNDYIKNEERLRIEKFAPKYNKTYNNMRSGVWLNEEQFKAKHGE